jgi:hypothetical protein
MMTNLARGGETRVRIVLAGSMELEELFARPEFQAFNQRIAARCYVEPFDRAETLDYLRFQVAVAGGQVERVFDHGALDAVNRASEGIPRLINQLCDHALILAYQAEQRPLNAKAIDVAWADLQQLPSPWQHEHATESPGAGSATIEFGALKDDEAEQSAPSSLADGANDEDQHTQAWPPRLGKERVELDFSADWSHENEASEAFVAGAAPGEKARSAPRRATVAAHVNPSLARTKGLKVVEDPEKLQVVVDPYGGLYDDVESEDSDEPVEETDSAVQDEFAQPGASGSAREIASDSATGHELANVWEDVIIPLAPPGWSTPATPASRPASGPSRHSAGSPAPSLGGDTTSSKEALQEEIVADRYAELDARQPRPLEVIAAKPSTSGSAIPKPHERTSSKGREAGATDQLALADLGLNERVTLAEAMRLRQEAEAATAVARVLSESPKEKLRLSIDGAPPLPSPTDWLTDSATMVLDPTQLPPGSLIEASAAALESDVIVIDDEAPVPAPTTSEPIHRVERKEYKSLFARLRGK